MATYSSTEAGATVQEKTSAQGVISKTSTYLITTVKNVTNNVLKMIKIPSGATVIGVVLQSGDLDSGTDMTISVGDGDSTARYISASDIAQAGGSVWSANFSALKKYTADDTIDILIAAQAGTAAEGSVTLHVLYTMDA